MERLNIQLSRHIQTTRRPRWVVWLSVLFFLSIGLFVYIATTLWFTRDAIYEASPESTVVALRFFVGSSKQEEISGFLKNIPIISNRTIAFSDLNSYINGEFAVFLEKDGTHSVALRVNKPLPQTILDAQHIVQKQISKNIVLLSEEAKQTHKLNVTSKVFPTFSFPGKTWIGEIVVLGQPKRGWIYNTNDRLVLSLPAKNHRSSFFGIPKNTIAFLSVKMSSQESDEQLLTPFIPLIAPVIGPKATIYLNQLSSKIDSVFLTKDEKGTGFFLSILQPSAVDEINIRELLQSITALNTPRIQKTLLEDGTFMQELISDPDSVSVEHITILGIPMDRVTTSHQTLLAGPIDNKHLVITNREDLLRFYKEKSKNEKKTLCGANSLGISLEELNGLVKSHSIFIRSTPFEQLNEYFSSIGVKNKMYSTEIHICKK